MCIDMYIQSQIIHFHKIKERLLHVWHSKQFPICLKHLHYPWSARLCLPVPSQKMKFTKRDACWVLNCALINLRFMSLVSTFNDTQRLTRMIQWSISFSLNVLMSFRTHDQCLCNQYMQCHIVRFFRLTTTPSVMKLRALASMWGVPRSCVKILSLSLVSSRCRSGPHEI